MRLPEGGVCPLTAWLCAAWLLHAAASLRRKPLGLIGVLLVISAHRLASWPLLLWGVGRDGAFPRLARLLPFAEVIVCISCPILPETPLWFDIASGAANVGAVLLALSRSRQPSELAATNLAYQAVVVACMWAFSTTVCAYWSSMQRRRGTHQPRSNTSPRLSGGAVAGTAGPHGGGVVAVLGVQATAMIMTGGLPCQGPHPSHDCSGGGTVAPLSAAEDTKGRVEPVGTSCRGGRGPAESDGSGGAAAEPLSQVRNLPPRTPEGAKAPFAAEAAEPTSTAAITALVHCHDGRVASARPSFSNGGGVRDCADDVLCPAAAARAASSDAAAATGIGPPPHPDVLARVPAPTLDFPCPETRGVEPLEATVTPPGAGALGAVLPPYTRYQPSLDALASVKPGPRSYKPFLRHHVTHVKLQGVEPSMIQPGYQERLRELIHARTGRLLSHVYVRAGCIELVLDCEEWGSEALSLTRGSPAGSWCPSDDYGPGAGREEQHAVQDAVAAGAGASSCEENRNSGDSVAEGQRGQAVGSTARTGAGRAWSGASDGGGGGAADNSAQHSLGGPQAGGGGGARTQPRTLKAPRAPTSQRPAAASATRSAHSPLGASTSTESASSGTRTGSGHSNGLTEAGHASAEDASLAPVRDSLDCTAVGLGTCEVVRALQLQLQPAAAMRTLLLDGSPAAAAEGMTLLVWELYDIGGAGPGTGDSGAVVGVGTGGTSSMHTATATTTAATPLSVEGQSITRPLCGSTACRALGLPRIASLEPRVLLAAEPQPSQRQPPTMVAGAAAGAAGWNPSRRGGAASITASTVNGSGCAPPPSVQHGRGAPRTAFAFGGAAGGVASSTSSGVAGSGSRAGAATEPPLTLKAVVRCNSQLLSAASSPLELLVRSEGRYLPARIVANSPVLPPGGDDATAGGSDADVRLSYDIELPLAAVAPPLRPGIVLVDLRVRDVPVHAAPVVVVREPGMASELAVALASSRLTDDDRDSLLMDMGTWVFHAAAARRAREAGAGAGGAGTRRRPPAQHGQGQAQSQAQQQLLNVPSTEGRNGRRDGNSTDAVVPASAAVGSGERNGREVDGKGNADGCEEGSERLGLLGLHLLRYALAAGWWRTAVSLAEDLDAMGLGRGGPELQAAAAAEKAVAAAAAATAAAAALPAAAAGPAAIAAGLAAGAGSLALPRGTEAADTPSLVAGAPAPAGGSRPKEVTPKVTGATAAATETAGIREESRAAARERTERRAGYGTAAPPLVTAVAVGPRVTVGMRPSAAKDAVSGRTSGPVSEPGAGKEACCQDGSAARPFLSPTPALPLFLAHRSRCWPALPVRIQPPANHHQSRDGSGSEPGPAGGGAAGDGSALGRRGASNVAASAAALPSCILTRRPLSALSAAGRGEGGAAGGSCGTPVGGGGGGGGGGRGAVWASAGDPATTGGGGAGSAPLDARGALRLVLGVTRLSPAEEAAYQAYTAPRIASQGYVFTIIDLLALGALAAKSLTGQVEEVQSRLTLLSCWVGLLELGLRRLAVPVHTGAGPVGAAAAAARQRGARSARSARAGGGLDWPRLHGVCKLLRYMSYIITKIVCALGFVDIPPGIDSYVTGVAILVQEGLAHPASCLMPLRTLSFLTLLRAAANCLLINAADQRFKGGRLGRVRSGLWAASISATELAVSAALHCYFRVAYSRGAAAKRRTAEQRQ